jgi:tetratricopeptide (TPR) repeat protein/DNA-binding CsgD family transcriptional regulator
MRQLYCFFFIFLTGWSYAQKSPIPDSLLAALPNQPDTTKTLTYAKLCFATASSDINQAQKYGQTGVALARKINFLPGEFENLRTLGAVFAQRSNYAIGLDYFLAALQVAEKLPNPSRLARVLRNVGMIHNARHEPQKSLPFYERSLQLFEQMDDSSGRASVLAVLGEAYLKLNQYEKGLTMLHQSMVLWEKLNRRHDYALAMTTYAWGLKMRGRYREAIPYYEKGVAILEDEKFAYGIGNAQNNLAEIYYELGNYQKAERYAQAALQTMRPIGIWSEIRNGEKNLFQVYTALGDKTKARQHFETFEAAQDSVFGQQRSQAIAEVETRYETKLKDEQIAGLNQKNQLQQYLLWASIVGGSLLLVVLGLLYNRYQLRDKEKRAIEQQRETERELSQAQQEKLQLELDLKHRELASNALFAYQKNEMLGDLKNQVDELLIDPDKPQKQKLKAIQKFIQSNLHFEDEWDAFKLHFEHVHPRFFEKLQTNFPDLTPNELKLCAYTRINLSNKEIARLLNINSSSVEMARYRMKKKVGLEGQTTITDFIQTI